jgi:Ni/Co efflux regulator RcnB
VLKNPRHYRLAKASGSTRWLKVRDDAVLVNLRTGRIVNIVYRLF